MTSGLVTLLALFVASEAVLLIEDRSTALLALGVGAFQVLVLLLTTRLVSPPGMLASEPLRATGSRPRIILRTAIVLVATAAVYIYTFWFGGELTAPIIDRFVSIFARQVPELKAGLINFTLYAVAPGTLVFACGARLREVGLGRPARGTLLCLVVYCVPFVTAWVVHMKSTKIALPMLGIYLLRNILSNGFSEEFLFRGLWLAHARAFLRTDWALSIQALGFAFLHLGTSLHDERTGLGIVANIVALNAPLGYVLGIIALRTKSLWLPIAIHTAYDTSRTIWTTLP